MKTLYTLLTIILVALLLPFCRKSDSVNGSPYTKLMCGSHNFHYITGGYNPYVQQYVTDSSDITAAITCNNAGSVLFASATFLYDSTSAAGVLHFGYQSPDDLFNSGSLDFDHVNNTINVYESIHVSAGAGNWTYTYTSF